MSLVVPFLLDKQNTGVTSYSDLSDKPSINGVSLVGNKTSAQLNIDGTTDYVDLSNKPSINGVSLVGNKTTSDLNIGSGASFDEYDVTSEITLNTSVAKSGGELYVYVYDGKISMVDFNIPLKNGASFSVGNNYEIGTFTSSARHYYEVTPYSNSPVCTPLNVDGAVVGVCLFGIGTLAFICTSQFTATAYSRAYFSQMFFNRNSSQ